MSLRYKQTPFGTEILGLVEAMTGIPKTEKENTMREDNWMHKSACMRCLTCAFFVPKTKNDPGFLDEPVLGRCRKHAPTLNGWPAVFENDWCGDHKLDENKLSAHLSLQRGKSEGSFCRIPGQERKEDR
jgi:hypothetical protein